jgi:probable phosphoglycerate mutase
MVRPKIAICKRVPERIPNATDAICGLVFELPAAAARGISHVARDRQSNAMTTFLLIRHASVDALGRYLAGRAPGEHLNALGRQEAQALAARLAPIHLDALYSSPLERARETAESIACDRDLAVEISDELLELDFGEWTRSTFEQLASDPRWERFNRHRSGTRIPGGELMMEAQARAVSFVEAVAVHRPGAVVAAVTHGDVIRGAVSHYLGMPLDFYNRFDVAPASVSVLEVTDHGAKVHCVNATERLPGCV